MYTFVVYLTYPTLDLLLYDWACFVSLKDFADSTSGDTVTFACITAFDSFGPPIRLCISAILNLRIFGYPFLNLSTIMGTNTSGFSLSKFFAS